MWLRALEPAPDRPKERRNGAADAIRGPVPLPQSQHCGGQVYPSQLGAQLKWPQVPPHEW